MTEVPGKIRKAYGELPPEWKLEKLKFFADIRNSNVDKTISEDEAPVRLCNYTDVYYNDCITPDLHFMEGSATEAEIVRFQLKRGQVILTKDSETWDDIGVPALVSTDMPSVLCGYHLSVVEPGPKLDGGFLSWLCRAEPLNDQFKLAANGITRFGLGQYPMKNAFIALPPLATQQRIARFLDEKTAKIDGLIEKKRALLDLLAEKRQALITRAVTKGINLDDTKKPGRTFGTEIVDGAGGMITVATKIRWVTTNLDHKRIPLNATERGERQGNIPYWGANGVLDHVDEALINETVILIGEDGAPFLDQYKDVAFQSAGPIWPNNHIHILRPDRSKLCDGFLCYWLNTVPYAKYINGSTRDKLTQEQLGSIEIELPPLATQRRIAQFLDEKTAEIDRLHDLVVQSVDKLTEYRSALITAAVTGQLAELQ